MRKVWFAIWEGFGRDFRGILARFGLDLGFFSVMFCCFVGGRLKWFLEREIHQIMVSFPNLYCVVDFLLCLVDFFALISWYVFGFWFLDALFSQFFSVLYRVIYWVFQWVVVLINIALLPRYYWVKWFGDGFVCVALNEMWGPDWLVGIVEEYFFMWWGIRVGSFGFILLCMWFFLGMCIIFVIEITD